MRQVLIIGVWCALLSSALTASSSHISAGVFVNPAADTILCDTGPIATSEGNQASLTLRVIVSTFMAPALVAIEHRNAANNALVTTTEAVGGESFAYAVPVNDQRDIRDYLVIHNDGERVRVRLLMPVTGYVQCRMSYAN